MLNCDKNNRWSLDQYETLALICITWTDIFLGAHSQSRFWVHWVQFPSQAVLQVDFWLFISHLLIAAVLLTPTRFPSGIPESCDSVSPEDVGSLS